MYTAAAAKNQFGEALKTALAEGEVGITRYGRVEAYVLSAERYATLTRSPEAELDLLTAHFDEMVARMQTTESRAAVLASFDATAEELGRAAAAGARRRAVAGA